MFQNILKFLYDNEIAQLQRLFFAAILISLRASLKICTKWRFTSCVFVKQACKKEGLSKQKKVANTGRTETLVLEKAAKLVDVGRVIARRGRCTER